MAQNEPEAAAPAKTDEAEVGFDWWGLAHRTTVGIVIAAALLGPTPVSAINLWLWYIVVIVASVWAFKGTYRATSLRIKALAAQKYADYQARKQKGGGGQ